jgi:hypothetical protein
MSLALDALDETEEELAAPPPTMKYHAFLSHDYGKDEHGRDNHQTVSIINAALKDRGLVTWFDEEQLVEGSVYHEIVDGVAESVAFVAFFTDRYITKINEKRQREYCFMEFQQALDKCSPYRMLAVPMEDRVMSTRKWVGVASYLKGRIATARFNKDTPIERGDPAFEAEIDKLFERIKSICAEYGRKRSKT